MVDLQNRKIGCVPLDSRASDTRPLLYNANFQFKRFDHDGKHNAIGDAGNDDEDEGGHSPYHDSDLSEDDDRSEAENYHIIIPNPRTTNDQKRPILTICSCHSAPTPHPSHTTIHTWL